MAVWATCKVVHRGGTGHSPCSSALCLIVSDRRKKRGFGVAAPNPKWRATLESSPTHSPRSLCRMGGCLLSIVACWSLLGWSWLSCERSPATGVAVCSTCVGPAIAAIGTAAMSARCWPGKLRYARPAGIMPVATRGALKTCSGSGASAVARDCNHRALEKP